jgi:hypothetical protein
LVSGEKNSKEREGFLLGEMFADGIIRRGGFTGEETASGEDYWPISLPFPSPA